MSDRKPRTVWIWIAGTLLSVPALYVFSIGRALSRLSTSPTGERVYRAIYSPIYWFADHSDFVDEEIANYLPFCAGTRVYSQQEMRQLLGDLPR